jgi:hypothetical protein
LPVANGGTGTSNGSITGTSSLTFASTGATSNVSVTPGASGYTLLGGSVGIGTTSPGSALEINGGSGAGKFSFQPTVNPTFTLTGDPTNGYYPSIAFSGVGGAIGNLEGYAGTGLLYNFNTHIFRSAAGSEYMRIASGGKVGIGTTSPGSALQVGGSITNTVSSFTGAFTCGTSTIDFSTSNFQRLTPSGVIAAGSCTVTLVNLVAGGNYSLVVTGNAATNAVTYAFGGYTFKYLPTNAATTAGKDSIYTFLYDGTTVYVTWASGY